MRKCEPEPTPKCDLHIHSSFSDGIFAPEVLCEMAVAAGLSHVALCDHDTTDGILPMQRAADSLNQAQPSKPLHFLPGIEVSAGAHGNIHVLGYGAHPDKAEICRYSQDARRRRLERFSGMVARLAELGVEIPEEQLAPLRDISSVGRAHLARMLVRLRIVKTVDAAFQRFLNEGRPAYLPYDHLSATEAVAFLRRAGCVPILAHPVRLPMSMEGRFALIRALQEEGLMGIEVFHPSASRRDVQALERFAGRSGLLISGGSDFHGDLNKRSHIGFFPGEWTQEAMDALLSAIDTSVISMSL